MRTNSDVCRCPEPYPAGNASTMAHPRRSRRAYTLPPTTPLSQQVGGHAGVHVTEDESLLLKPALPREISFYQLARDIADPATGLHALKPWIPKFFGLLNFEGKLADPVADLELGTAPAIIPAADAEAPSMSSDPRNATTPQTHAQMLVLQNLLYGYRKPCVLDVKLGTVLYDEDTPEEKKARMIKKAAESTSLQTGIRLTGFQVSMLPSGILREIMYAFDRSILITLPTLLCMARRMGIVSSRNSCRMALGTSSLARHRLPHP